MALIDRIRATASARGLAGIGVCTAEPFDDVRRHIERRVESGASAGMRFTFGDPAGSTDITSSFAWARRLVVGAWSYLPGGGSPGPAAVGAGRVARFATENHYLGLRRALGAVAVDLAATGHRAEVLVDDHRLVDRAAAVRAGVAWWGKSTMALAPGAGPWLLLGSVVTDADLPVSEPMRRDCGTCDACIPACPTGALRTPGHLDARLCLAYWAQAPGSIPPGLRVAMGDRIYGCDDCLEACPPGHRALAGARSRRGRVDLVALLAADDRSLMRRFEHFYLPRRNPRFLRRNALVALGNCGGRDAVMVVAGYAGHPDPLLRAHAVWALGALGSAAARAALRAASARERDPSVIAELEATRADTLGQC